MEYFVSSCPPRFFCPWQAGSRAPARARPAAAAAAAPALPDVFLLDLAEKLEDSVSKGAGDERRQNAALRALRDGSAEVAVTCKWPSSRDEAYRFTNVKFLKDVEIQPRSPSIQEEELEEVSIFERDQDGDDGDNDRIRLVFVDGIFSPALSRLDDVPAEVYAGSVLGAPEDQLQKYVLPRISEPSALIDKDAFVSLNGIGALDLGLVLVPGGFKLEKPIHIVYYSTRRKNNPQVVSMSNPRLLVVAAEGSRVHLVEEFRGGDGSSCLTNSVSEIVVETGASVAHDLVQTQGRSSVSMKKTYVSQGRSSSYKCVDVELGSKLSRHNLHIEQLDSDTKTEILTFLLCGHDQLQDLHSRLILNHPRGFARQLQKCIVTNSTGHGVFDGTIRVNRDAQQTDAGQLSRSLLLAPRATVNAKPSLQIKADDVKCTHGVAISDLDENQLFYFRARGIDARTARSALVFSFGAEVIEKLECRTTRNRVEELLKDLLSAEKAV